MWKLLVILSATVLNAALGANILFVTVLPSPSHHIWHETIVEGLLRNGHNVTLIGHGKPAIKSANYTMLQIEIEDLLSDESKAEIVDSFQQPFLLAQIEMWKFTVDLAKHDLDSPILTRLMEYPADSFDVIVYDMIVQHLLPLADHFGKIPIVGTSPYGSNPILAESFGHHFYTYFPNSALPYTVRAPFLHLFPQFSFAVH
ncbi:hypothetical protein QE152_g6684 [Popillia japonica]|uniref:Uncharacterized protein n=1 Tax=Popillia japonica TaxID=7064 RepID=A0AAW1MHJ0_POPJA